MLLSLYYLSSLDVSAFVHLRRDYIAVITCSYIYVPVSWYILTSTVVIQSMYHKSRSTQCNS